ncbi:reverse transcriptase domain-containing protein [Tanacetum coccineum]|uniref:Reverse transcriptase domain-containing protein n=1 Tax=Tanacetum coccineum TaxID=301880 RepID=A0ABQ5ELQ1_9ASTR
MVEEGMFLGYKVNAKRLKICTDKVDVVLSLLSPKCLKDVQKFNGKLASMNRFLAISAEKSLLLFKTLKKHTKKSNFHWTMEAEEAFKKMEKLIAELPIITTLMEKEVLIVYLAVTKETVSAVLMTKKEAKQMHIYFVSRALRGPELNYTSMEKLILADFIVERPEEDSLDTPMEEEEELLEPWILFIDGSSYLDGSGAGLILINPEGREFTYTLRFGFDTTNNKAEYEALIVGLRIAEQMGVKNLKANVDSRLVANQVKGTYVAKETDMIRYLEKVKALTGNFKAFSIKQITRKLKEKSIGEVEILAVVEEEGDTWMTPLFKYLTERTLLADVKKAREIRRNANRSLGEGIKARLDVRSKNLIAELPHVLCAHRTMIKSINGDTTFSLTYRTKAVILVEIGMPTLRTAEVDLVQNNEALEIKIDLLEERIEKASIRDAKSKAKMEKYFTLKV